MSLAPGEALPGHTTPLAVLGEAPVGPVGQSGVHGEHQDLTAGEGAEERVWGEGRGGEHQPQVCGSRRLSRCAVCHLAPQCCSVKRGGGNSQERRSAGRSWEGWEHLSAGWGHVWGRLHLGEAEWDSTHGLHPAHLNRRASAPVERAVSLSALPGATRKLPFLMRAHLYPSAETGACVRAAEANTHPMVLHPTSWGRANTSAKGLEVFVAEVGK